MNPGLKQRLVGAVVLVALAVIFLPMLLDGSGARENLNEEIAIPAKPEAPASQLAREGEAEDAFSIDDTATRSAEEPTSSTEENAVGESGQAPTTGGSTTAGDAAPAKTPDVSDADAGSRPAGEVTEGWVVQVGSFRKETNALVLRDKLRQQGFDANAQSVEQDGTTLWRVWLGPVAERSEGEALERRIEDRRGSDALLMAYP